MERAQLIIAIFSGLTVTIPLVIKLVEYVQKATKEKNWSEIVRLVLGYMTEAERKFSDGATRKEWVMSMVKQSARSIEYELDDDAINKISDMIDNICAAAKTINTPDESPDNQLMPDKYEIGDLCAEK